MKIVYLPLALDDLLWFRRYYRQVFPAGQRNGSAHYLASVKLLIENPKIGKPTEGKSRILAIPRTPFSLIYTITGDEIRIIRVFDNRAEPPESTGT